MVHSTTTFLGRCHGREQEVVRSVRVVVVCAWVEAVSDKQLAPSASLES